uniref:Actin-like ATPase domain-containing protein n=1 Tax=Panagrolaimus sp. ES5 TaxID=591445 RepID=A0AC34FB76_9BILA
MSVENEYLLRGEDVSAVVFDIRSNALVGGYGGLYTSPQCSVSPYVGIREEDNGNLKKRQFIDDPDICIPHEGAELKKYIEKSKIVDWDLFENVFEYLYTEKLRFDPTLSPLLFIEGNVYDRKHREKLAEILFEKFNTKALCVMPIAPLIIFRREPTYSGVVVDIGTDETTVSLVYDRNHREKLAEILFEKFNTKALCVTPIAPLIIFRREPTYSGVVVDIGTDETTVSLVSDGYLLRKNVKSVDFGLDTVAGLCGELLNNKKINFALNLQSKYSFPVHSSYEEVAQRKFLNEFAQKVLYCQKKPFKDSLIPAPNVDFTFGSKKYSFDAEEQCKIIECLFDPTVTPSNTENFNGLYKLIEDTVDPFNIDSVANFYSRIYTNGEGTLFKGFGDRLNHELTKTPPRLQARLNLNVKGYEKNSAWKQGGIIAGMGTTGQLWVSKMEFEDGSRKLHYL